MRSAKTSRAHLTVILNAIGMVRLFFLFLATGILIGCSKNDETSQQELLGNIVSQICPNVRGVQALYWDVNNGVLRGDIPGGLPTIKNPGDHYIHSGYPALGFQMPRGYRAVELRDDLNGTIGVNVLRNDDNALWRYVTTRFFGRTNANDVLQVELNQMLTSLGLNSQQVSVVCSNGAAQQLAPDMQSTTATALVRAGNFTALLAVNVNVLVSSGTSFIGIQMTLGPTAEYDALVLDAFLPIGYQLLFINRERVQDSDGDGVPDHLDGFPFDPTRS